MDLMTLDQYNQPYQMVENYDSLIWTERYNTIGDFQIETGDVEGFMELLPEGQMITLRESNVPMIVETHWIERKKNTPTKLTITGRALTSILDRRVAIEAVRGGVGEWVIVAKTPSDVAYYMVNQIVVQGLVDPADIFPPESFQFPTPDDYLTSTGPNRSFSIPRGNLLASVLQLIQADIPADTTTTPPTPAVVPHGIRAVRPDADGQAVAIQFYTGTDRYETVYFDGTRDLLNDGSYLFSRVGSANTGYAIGPDSGTIINISGAAITGLDRRVILIDGSTSGATDEATIVEHAKMSLSEAHPTAAFDGSINQDLNPYVYGVDYFLGDVVKLVGDYGLTTKARVTEYIRAEDVSGHKAFPTLTTVVD